MPPKVATDNAEDGAATGAVTSLTPKETLMLAVVVSFMGDVPNVDFNLIAPLVGQKYAKNARASCKKLFEKLKANAPAGPAAGTAADADADADAATASTSTSTNAGGEGEGIDDVEGGQPVTSKKAFLKKGTATPRKKGTATPRKTGPRNTAKKFTAVKGVKAKPKEKSAEKAVAEEAVAEEAVAEAELTELADNDDDEMKNGKSFPTAVAFDAFAPFVFQSGRRLPLISSMCGYMATFPVGYSFPVDATEEELYKAHLYEMTVEKWRTDKIVNNCDPERAITPC